MYGVPPRSSVLEPVAIRVKFHEEFISDISFEHKSTGVM